MYYLVKKQDIMDRNKDIGNRGKNFIWLKYAHFLLWELLDFGIGCPVQL